MRKADRDRVNIMLQDGVPYPEIIAKLGDAGKDLLPRNVGNWHNGPGYQRWLKDQDWLEDMRADQECGLDVLPDFDAGKFNEAALQVAITQLFRAFRHLGSTPMKDKLGGDPQAFARLVNALACACCETVNLQKQHEASAKAAASEPKRLDPNRKLDECELELIRKKTEEVFSITLPRPGETEAGQSPTSGVQSPKSDFQSSETPPSNGPTKAPT
jgi:hypothetical protein